MWYWRPRKTACIKRENVDEAFANPKGILRNSYNPLCVAKAVFGFDSSSTSTCQ